MAKDKFSRIARNIQKDIDESISKLVILGYADDQNYCSTQQYGSDSFSLNAGEGNVGDGLKADSYKDLYTNFRNTRCYAVRMLDGALIQLSYDINGGVLERHRLAYLPAPDLTPYLETPDLYFEENIFADMAGSQIIPVPIRFDYDSESAIEIYHPKSHLTLGQYKNCRIPVSGPLAPIKFIEFIIRNFYVDQNNFESFSLSDSCNFSSSISQSEQQYSHFLVSGHL